MVFPSREQAEKIREEYPAGTRIEFVSTTDPYSRLQQGDLGTVRYVDDAGTIHINWDCGSSLGMVPGEDEFFAVEKEQER